MTRSKPVSERTRELETFRFATTLIADCVHGDHGVPLDTSLTAFAQLGACQTGCARSLISIFDSAYQYIVAEATPQTSLVPAPGSREDDVWLVGTAKPRQYGICEAALAQGIPGKSGVEQASNGDADDGHELPLTIVPDLAADPSLRNKTFCRQIPSPRFYAAVPIRTPRGIDIGVYCVIHTAPVDSWGDNQTRLMRDISHTIMNYLSAHQVSSSYRRSERVNRALGSFMEDKSTITGWQHGPHTSAYTVIPNREGALNKEQQDVEEQKQTHDLPSPDAASAGAPPPDPSNSSQKPDELQNLEGVFSRAANIIREAFEVEGCMFVDTSFHGKETTTSTAQGQTLSKPLEPATRGSSDDDNGKSGSGSQDEDKVPNCEVIGFSTSESSSINQDAPLALHSTIPQKLMLKLLRRYPRGKIFSFDQNGELYTSDSSSSDDAREAVISPLDDEVAPGPFASSRIPWTRQRDGSSMLKIFPGARSVAFIPILAPGTSRWFVGGFVYTRTPTRVFTIEAELSYLRAFGTLAAVAAGHLKLAAEDKAKADLLSSISHEIRSPLHGIILGAELLNQTDLTIVQDDVVHTVETCGRTLSDTLDHLLDYSKINQYRRDKRKQQASNTNSKPIALFEKRKQAHDAGIQSLHSVVHLDQLVEEVAESVFAGYTFQRLSASRDEEVTRSDGLQLDKMERRRAQDDVGFNQPSTYDVRTPFRQILVLISIEPSLNWVFFTQPGAVRRIVMNLFANALKYTSQGAVQVSLSQKLVGGVSHVVLTVVDTGSAISKEFLGDGLYQPFSQENHMLPGTGLGLSIVKKTASQLNGHVSIQSSKGVGTSAIASLPLQPHSLGDGESAGENNNSASGMTAQEKKELQGLRVCLSGFKEHQLANSKPPRPPGVEPTGPTGLPVLQRICTEWLGLVLIEAERMKELAPDLLLCTEEEFIRSEDIKMASDTPCVVVCPNVVVAQKYSLERKESSRVVEYISQPLGPHKLARMLVLVFRRWVELRHETSNKPLPVRAHDSVASQETKGSELPDQSEGPAPSEQESTSHSVANGGEKESESRDIERTKSEAEFLLVDDNIINLKLLSAVMKKLGQSFSTAKDGKAAVDAYMESPQRWKCIVMDVSMPVMDGWEATRAIRRYEEENKVEPTVIIGLSGLGTAEARSEAVQCGMDMFQTKPVNYRNLEGLLISRDLLG